MKSSVYKKYVYWLTEKEADRARKTLQDQGLKVRMAKGVPCTPLDAFNKISIVAPSIWNDICHRQGSWYRESEKNGLYLVVSSFPVTGLENGLEAIVTLTDFKAPRLATVEDKQIMISDPEFKKKIPLEWMKLDEKDTKLTLKWAKKLDSRIENYETIYLTHTANHANFLTPRFFIKERDVVVPYSIDKSAYLCSCCLEIFQVLGRPFTKKLIAPCPGATLFARLESDRYLLVERPNRVSLK